MIALSKCVEFMIIIQALRDGMLLNLFLRELNFDSSMEVILWVL